MALIILAIVTASALSVIGALLVRGVFDTALFVQGGPDLGALYPLVAALNRAARWSVNGCRQWSLRTV